MLTKELQNLTDKLGGVVLVEDGKPKFVLLSYKKFDELSGGNGLEPHNDPATAVHESTNSGFEHVSSGISHKQNKLVNLYQTNRIEPVIIEDGELIERLNKEIMTLKEEIEAKEKELGLTADAENIR